MLTPASTLVCRVRRRLPVAVVYLYGTFDDTSAVNGVITLRERLADQPMAVVLEASHLTVSGAAAGLLRQFVDDCARWPGAPVALCAALPSVRTALTAARAPAPRAGEGALAGEGSPAGGGAQSGAGARLDLFDRVEDAVREALRRPVPPRCTVALEPDRRAPERARAAVARSCARWGIPRLSQLAQVIVSELVSNAVVHARTRMEVTARLAGDVLHLAVRDGDPRLLVDPGGGVAADGHGYGRGLLIVDAMSDSWGCVPTGEGKVVWARLALPG